jgi:AcrR family transcriptional regulator
MDRQVNARRSYDASRRRARAAEDRARVLETARGLFLADGYGGTTVAAVARGSGVSPEFVYKAFGGKSGLVRAIYDRSLLGRGDRPAEERSDDAQAGATDGPGIARQLGSLAAEVSPLVAPVLLLIRSAAQGGDPAMAELLARTEEERHQRMLHNAHLMAARGLLRGDPAQAADVMWTLTSPELYQSLVLKRGWSIESFGQFIGEALTAVLTR